MRAGQCAWKSSVGGAGSNAEEVERQIRQREQSYLIKDIDRPACHSGNSHRVVHAARWPSLRGGPRVMSTSGPMLFLVQLMPSSERDRCHTIN